MINNITEFRDLYSSSFTHGSTFTPTSGHPNIDAFYGPYISVDVANDVFNDNVWNKVSGRTCGIESNGKIVEYWFQSNGANLELIEKTTNLAISVTWLQLITMKQSSNLNVGDLYNITDFTTTCIQSDCRVSPSYTNFSIMMLATATNKLDEHVRIPEHEDWDVWYRLENDTTNFGWVDSNGKGVIYKMVDSYLNETPYDSANIEFDTNKVSYDVDKEYNFKRIDLDSSIIDKDEAKGTWIEKYWGTGVSVIGDSVSGGTWVEDWKNTFNTTAYGFPARNTIKLYTDFETNPLAPITKLNQIIMQGFCYSNNLDLNCWKIYMSGGNVGGNNIGGLCHDIMFDGGTEYLNDNIDNIINNGCSNIYIGDSSYINIGNNNTNIFIIVADATKSEVGVSNVYTDSENNIINAYSSDIVINGNGHNIIGRYCEDITILDNTYLNIFGFSNKRILLKNYCGHNKFSDYCQDINLDESCSDNELGYSNIFITLDYNSTGNVFKDYCKYLHINTLSNLIYFDSFIKGNSGRILTFDIVGLQHETKVIKTNNKELYHEYFDDATEMNQQVKLNIISD